MTKSIFVIDTPSICGNCARFPLCSLEYALLYGKELTAVSKPIKEICKLQQMPRLRVPFNEFDEFALGWNACINEILKED